MLGKAKYHYGDNVRFQIENDSKIGMIKVIDAYGTFLQNDETSYDIEVGSENCLYKHIRESMIIEKV